MGVVVFIINVANNILSNVATGDQRKRTLNVNKSTISLRSEKNGIMEVHNSIKHIIKGTDG